MRSPAAIGTQGSTVVPPIPVFRPCLGGSIEPVHNPVDVVEHAMSKGASAILMPVSCRRQLVDLSDDVATKVQVLFYSDAADALRKVLHEG
jgi:ATP-dependent Lon protease